MWKWRFYMDFPQEFTAYHFYTIYVSLAPFWGRFEKLFLQKMKYSNKRLGYKKNPMTFHKKVLHLPWSIYGLMLLWRLNWCHDGSRNRKPIKMTTWCVCSEKWWGSNPNYSINSYKLALGKAKVTNHNLIIQAKTDY